MNTANHKTVIVLDHTPYFGVSSGTEVEFPWVPEMSPLSKSLWTCSVEPVIEYCRIVWELFPQGKLVRIIASDTESRCINSWIPTHQMVSHIVNEIAAIGVPPAILRPEDATLDYSVCHGLQTAIVAMSEPTDQQNKAIINIPEGEKISNNCRVICITCVQNDECLNWLEGEFQRWLDVQNEAIHTFNRLLMVDHCHLVILNMFPSSIKSDVTAHPPKILSPNLTVEAHSIEASKISFKLYPLILDHYGLASTTISYFNDSRHVPSPNVEFFHSIDVHRSILSSNIFNLTEFKRVKDGMGYETLVLNSNKFRGDIGSILQNSLEVHGISPVNSTAAFCYIKNILKGVSHALMVPTKVGGTFISHILTARGDDLFIYSLHTTRSPLVGKISNTTTIHEDCMTRDYRIQIQDFGSFIRQNTLRPIKQSLVSVSSPVAMMKMRLNCQTRHWPMTKSSSLLFNLKNYLEPLLSLIRKRVLNDEEVFQCNNVIYNLNACELKMKPLPLLYDTRLMKGRRLEDQYQAVWDELRALLKENLHSDNHIIVYRCLMGCHRNNFGSGRAAEQAKLYKALQELDSSEDDDSDDSSAAAGPSSLYDIVNSQRLAKEAEGRKIDQLKPYLYAEKCVDEDITEEFK